MRSPSRQLSGPSRACALLALALTLLGSLQIADGGTAGRLAPGAGAGCVDTCGCPPTPAADACCCGTSSDETSGGGASFALLTGGAGCVPPAPAAVSASPAGPILDQHADAILPTLPTPSHDGPIEPRALTARSTRPPVPPPRA